MAAAAEDPDIPPELLNEIEEAPPLRVLPAVVGAELLYAVTVPHYLRNDLLRRGHKDLRELSLGPQQRAHVAG